MLADPPPFSDTFRPGGVRLLLAEARDGVDDGRVEDGVFVLVGVVGRLVDGFDVGVFVLDGVVGRLVDGRVV